MAHGTQHPSQRCRTVLVLNKPRWACLVPWLRCVGSFCPLCSSRVWLCYRHSLHCQPSRCNDCAHYGHPGGGGSKRHWQGLRSQSGMEIRTHTHTPTLPRLLKVPEVQKEAPQDASGGRQSRAEGGHLQILNFLPRDVEPWHRGSGSYRLKPGTTMQYCLAL